MKENVKFNGESVKNIKWNCENLFHQGNVKIQNKKKT